MWTRFMDMHSGGGLKEKWQYIYIEAPQEEAEVIFYNRFGHAPSRVTCTCCGNDYVVNEAKSLEQISASERGCKWDQRKKRYVEESGGESWSKYRTIRQWLRTGQATIIRAKSIKAQERVGEVPQQGYVWQD